MRGRRKINPSRLIGSRSCAQRTPTRRWCRFKNVISFSVRPRRSSTAALRHGFHQLSAAIGERDPNALTRVIRPQETVDMLSIPKEALVHRSRPRLSQKSADRSALLRKIPQGGISLKTLRQELGWSRYRLQTRLLPLVNEGILMQTRHRGAGRVRRKSDKSIQACETCPLTFSRRLRPAMVAIAAGHRTANTIAAATNTIPGDVSISLSHASRRLTPLVKRDGVEGRETRWALTDLGQSVLDLCGCKK